MEKIKNIVSYFLIFSIQCYQYSIARLFGNRCRFYPTCSTYAITALEKHPFSYAFYIILRRILRCQPYCQGGLDPVPEKKTPC